MAKKNQIALKLDTMQVDIAEERSNVYHVGVAMTWQIPKRPKYFGASYKAVVTAIKGSTNTFRMTFAKSTGEKIGGPKICATKNIASACEAAQYEISTLCRKEIDAEAEAYLASRK